MRNFFEYCAFTVNDMRFQKELEQHRKKEVGKIMNGVKRLSNERRMQIILDNENVSYGLIYAPTQVGKTAASIKFMTECLKRGNMVVYSTDNKYDQMDQSIERIRKTLEVELEHMDVDVLCIKTLSEKQFKSAFQKNLEKNTPTVILVMDNSSQIQKLTSRFLTFQHEGMIIPPYSLMHDEGDVVTKDVNVETVSKEQAESHKAWILFCKFFADNLITLKRIFITATPENVVMKYKITNVISLEVPSNYQGFNKINYKVLAPSNIPNIIRQETNSIRDKNQNGIILYNVERLREGNEKKSGQDNVLANVYQVANDIVVSIYNGNGISAYIPPEFRNKFKKEMEKFNQQKTKSKNRIQFTEVTNHEVVEHFFQIKNLSISWFYQFCKNIGMDVVLTIGCDLMSRGISYCSIKKEPNALAATVMIYRPSPQRHCVGLVQTIGRLTGTSRPDLPRTLYAPQKIIDDYKKTCENECDFIKALDEELEKNPEMNSEEFFKTFHLKRELKRCLDRPQLHLRPLYKKEQVVVENGNLEQQEIHRLTNDENGMFKRWAQVDNTSNIARFMKHGLDPNKEYTKKEITDLCKEYGVVLSNIINSVLKNNKNHGKIIIKQETKYVLNPALKHAFEKFF